MAPVVGYKESFGRVWRVKVRETEKVRCVTSSETRKGWKTYGVTVLLYLEERGRQKQSKRSTAHHGALGIGGVEDRNWETRTS